MTRVEMAGAAMRIDLRWIALCGVIEKYNADQRALAEHLKANRIIIEGGYEMLASAKAVDGRYRNLDSGRTVADIRKAIVEAESRIPMLLTACDQADAAWAEIEDTAGHVGGTYAVPAAANEA